MAARGGFEPPRKVPGSRPGVFSRFTTWQYINHSGQPSFDLGLLTKARAALVNLKLSPQPLPLNEVKGQKARTLVRVSIFINGVPGRNRTRNLLVRSQILYPVELPGRMVDLMRLKLTTFPLRREHSLN